MKKIIIVIFCFISININLNAQTNSESRVINTEEGDFTVQLDEIGHSTITFTQEQVTTLRIAEDIEGFEGSFDELPVDGSIGIHWNLATRKSKCKSGIGFRCGKKYQASLVISGNLRGNGRPDDRSFDVVIKKNRDGGVTLTFIDLVDWDWLLNS